MKKAPGRALYLSAEPYNQRTRHHRELLDALLALQARGQAQAAGAGRFPRQQMQPDMACAAEVAAVAVINER